MTTTTSSLPAPRGTTADTPRVPLRVTVFTDRSLFAQQWSQILGGFGLGATTALPSELPGSVRRGEALVIDAGAEPYDEDELLAHVGLARALGALPVVSVPSHVDSSAIDDLLDQLCTGLVARRPEDVERVVAVLARRADASRAHRFEYLTVSPRGGELLAVFSDGRAVLLERPVAPADDGSDIASIVLEDDATRAVLTLEGGEELELTSATVTDAALATEPFGIDGVKLGKQIRKLRLEAGLTQAELARRTGIHRPNIARVEAGRHTPSLETLARLAQAIGVPTRLVLGE